MAVVQVTIRIPVIILAFLLWSIVRFIDSPYSTRRCDYTLFNNTYEYIDPIR